MTECGPLLSSVLAGVRGRWSCREISPDTMLLITSHHFADGDAIELLVQIVEDEVVVSDGGEVLARLDSMGVNVDKRGRISDSWTRLLAAHALEHERGQLVRRANIEHAADLVQEMADAVTGVDGLRLLAPLPRRPAFPERLATYLEAEFPVVKPRAKLTGVSGSPYRVTAAAGTEQRLVYIQSAGGRTTFQQRSAMEHCFTLFTECDPAGGC
ncbi:MAG: DUF1828 domain-containing protein [Pseudonocardiaceae bacterium]